MSGERWAKAPLVLGAGDLERIARIETPIVRAFEQLLDLEAALGRAGGEDSGAETGYALGLVDALRWVRTGTISPQMLAFLEVGSGNLTEEEVFGG